MGSQIIPFIFAIGSIIAIPAIVYLCGITVTCILIDKEDKTSPKCWKDL